MASDPKVSRTYRIDPDIADRVAAAAASADQPIERWVEAALDAAAAAQEARTRRKAKP